MHRRYKTDVIKGSVMILVCNSALTSHTIFFFLVTLISPWYVYMPISLQPYGLQPTRLLCPWYFTGKNTGVGCRPPPRALPDSGIEPKSLASSALAGRFFTTESPGKPHFPTHFKGKCIKQLFIYVLCTEHKNVI